MIRTVLLLAAMPLLACRPASPTLQQELVGPPGSLAPRFAEAQNGSVRLSWIERGAGEHAAVRLARRIDGAWTAASTITEGTNLFVNWADVPAVAALADRDSTLLATWLVRAGGSTYAYHVQAALSSDGGGAWMATGLLHDDRSAGEHGFVSLVPTGPDHAAAIWLDQRQTPDAGESAESRMSLRATLLASQGGRGEDQPLDLLTCDCCPTAMAPVPDGLVAAYRDRTPEEIRDIAVLRWRNGVWSQPAIVARDNWHYAACPVNGPALAAEAERVALTWYTAADNDPRVQLAFSADGGDTFGEPIRIDNGQTIGRASLVWLNDQRVLIAWLAGSPPTAEIRLRTATPEGNLGPVHRLTEPDAVRARSFPRLYRTAGQILLAWTAAGDSGGVRVARVVGRP